VRAGGPLRGNQAVLSSSSSRGRAPGDALGMFGRLAIPAGRRENVLGDVVAEERGDDDQVGL
jgi:hypothetical protein